MTTVRAYLWPYEAAMDKSFLESCGIPAHLADDCSAAAGLGASVAPIRLQVDERDVEEATSLLAHRRDSPLTDNFVPPATVDNDAKAPGDRQPVSWWWVVLLLGISFLGFALLSPPSGPNRSRRPSHNSVIDPWFPHWR